LGYVGFFGAVLRLIAVYAIMVRSASMGSPSGYSGMTVEEVDVDVVDAALIVNGNVPSLAPLTESPG